MTRQELIDLLDNHDCKLSPEDGCECIGLRMELARVNYKAKQVPYKYHSKLITATLNKDLEEAKWNEVRGDRL